jgi:hypothetical protein
LTIHTLLQGFTSIIAYNTRHIYHKIRRNFFFIGLISIFWYLFRTGTKPSRASYPCQKAAAANANAWGLLYILPALAYVKRKAKKPAIVFIAALLVGGIMSPALMERTQTVQASTYLDLELVGQTVPFQNASDIFVIQNTTGADDGFDRMLDLMGQHDLLFYQSSTLEENQGPEGLIDADDVIIIKVNCQWDQRGGTNTDLLKNIIQAIIDHPDGFTGEIVVADNGQDQGGSGGGGSLDWANSNADDHAQSAQDVVDMFSGYGRWFCRQHNGELQNRYNGLLPEVQNRLWYLHKLQEWNLEYYCKCLRFR